MNFPSRSVSVAAPSSAGSGGRLFTPSYQNTSTGGISRRAAKSKRMVVACGKMNSLGPSRRSASMVCGKPRSRNWCAVSRMCAPQSPNAPVPYSNHPRQVCGCRRALKGCTGRAAFQPSQSMPGGACSPDGNPFTFQPCHLRSEFMNATIFVTSLITPASVHALNWK